MSDQTPKNNNKENRPYHKHRGSVKNRKPVSLYEIDYHIAWRCYQLVQEKVMGRHIPPINDSTIESLRRQHPELKEFLAQYGIWNQD